MRWDCPLVGMKEMKGSKRAKHMADCSCVQTKQSKWWGEKQKNQWIGKIGRCLLPFIFCLLLASW